MTLRIHLIILLMSLSNLMYAQRIRNARDCPSVQAMQQLVFQDITVVASTRLRVVAHAAMADTRGLVYPWVVYTHIGLIEGQQPQHARDTINQTVKKIAQSGVVGSFDADPACVYQHQDTVFYAIPDSNSP